MNRERLLFVNLAAIVFCCIAVYDDPRPSLNLIEGICIGVNLQMVIDHLLYASTQRHIQKMISQQMQEHAIHFAQFMDNYLSSRKVTGEDLKNVADEWNRQAADRVGTPKE